MEFVETINGLLIEMAMLAIRLLGVVLFFLFVKYAFPWLKEQRIYSLICKMVRAAEKLAESGQIEKPDKLLYVIDQLEKRKITVTPAVRSLIEAAVKELDLLENKITDCIGDEAAQQEEFNFNLEEYLNGKPESGESETEEHPQESGEVF